MENALVISQVVLFVLLLVVSFAVLLLYREFGIMYLNARENRPEPGPEVGSSIPPLDLLDIRSGQTVTVGSPGVSYLMLVMRYGCHPCEKVAGHVPAALNLGIECRVLVLGSPKDGTRLAAMLPPAVDVLVDASGRAAKELRVDRTPFALAISESGVVQAKGIPSTLEDLQWLYEHMVPLTETPGRR